MSGIGETYDKFWRDFLLDFATRFPDWQAKIRNPHWISCPSSKPSLLKYSASWSRRPTDHLKVEGYIEFQSKERNKEVFDALFEQRDRVEEMVGERLKWNRKSDMTKSSIELRFPSPIGIAEEERWPEAKQWLLDALRRMRGAFDPTLDRLSI